MPNDRASASIRCKHSYTAVFWPLRNCAFKRSIRKILASRMFRIQLLRTILAFLVFSLSTIRSMNAEYSSSIALDMHVMHVVQRSKAQSLRRCTSLSADLSQVDDDLMAPAKSMPLAYSPAHSNGSKSESSLRSSRTQRPLLRCGDKDIMWTWAQERMYTLLQTQLYPDMEF
jgi:hypothetical protein